MPARHLGNHQPQAHASFRDRPELGDERGTVLSIDSSELRFSRPPKSGEFAFNNSWKEWERISRMQAVEHLPLEVSAEKRRGVLDRETGSWPGSTPEG